MVMLGLTGLVTGAQVVAFLWRGYRAVVRKVLSAALRIGTLGLWTVTVWCLGKSHLKTERFSRLKARFVIPRHIFIYAGIVIATLVFRSVWNQLTSGDNCWIPRRIAKKVNFAMRDPTKMNNTINLNNQDMNEMDETVHLSTLKDLTMLVQELFQKKESGTNHCDQDYLMKAIHHVMDSQQQVLERLEKLLNAAENVDMAVVTEEPEEFETHTNKIHKPANKRTKEKVNPTKKPSAVPKTEVSDKTPVPDISGLTLEESIKLLIATKKAGKPDGKPPTLTEEEQRLGMEDLSALWRRMLLDQGRPVKDNDHRNIGKLSQDEALLSRAMVKKLIFARRRAAWVAEGRAQGRDIRHCEKCQELVDMTRAEHFCFAAPLDKNTRLIVKQKGKGGITINQRKEIDGKQIVAEHQKYQQHKLIAEARLAGDKVPVADRNTTPVQDEKATQPVGEPEQPVVASDEESNIEDTAMVSITRDEYLELLAAQESFCLSSAE